MSGFSPTVSGLVQVDWNQDSTVNRITYNGVELEQVIAPLAQFQVFGNRIIPNQTLVNVVRSLLDTVVAIPSNDQRRKIFLADKIFGHIINIRLNVPNPKLEILFQSSIMQEVWLWEDTHEIIHKGTPYFFMVEKYLEMGDIPSAYICMFNALEEDKRNKPFLQEKFKDAPAYRTTSLVDNSSNYLYYSVVVPLRDYLSELITAYKARSMSNLSILDLDTKFLQNDSLEDIKRFFVATIHEIYHLTPINQSRMINNDYSKLKVIDTLFNLGLVVDQVLEYRFLQSFTGRKDMANAVHQLALYLGWTTEQDIRIFLTKIQPTPKSTPDTFLPCLLNGTATFEGNPLTDNKKKAIFATYHLRNYGGHHLAGSNTLIGSYRDILAMVMDGFFTSIDTL